YGYDAMNRGNRTVSPDGTITRTVYDWRDNPIQNWVGTNDTGATDSNPKGTGNMVQVAAAEYGSGGGTGCASCTGAKDKIRVAVQYVDSSKIRVVEYGYDWRGRQTHTFLEEDAEGNATHTVTTYDNMGRAVKSERFLSVQGTSPSSSGTSSGGSQPSVTDGQLLARTEPSYDERGRNWRTVQSVVNPANGTVTGKMQSLTWFDAAGRVIKSQGMGENHFTKSVYDSLGRTVKSYVSTNPADTTYATACVITTDTVHQQSEITYDNVGNVILAASVERMVSQVGTGELKIAAAPKGRYQFVASWFDPMGRQVAAANYGTNNDTALNRPATVATRSDNVLVTETFYDANTGRAFRTVDPAGKDHRTFFDSLGRTTKTVANYVTDTPVSGSPAQDVTVEMTYHPSGQVAAMTAKNATTGDQVTRYVYGTTKTSIAPIIYRNDLLVCEIYPDSDDFENPSGVLQNGPDGTIDRVEFMYNRIGERIQRKDQNGTVHVYEFDNLGRLLHDRVTTLGSGVDGAVRRISTAYDVVGNVKSVTSYNNATVGTGTVVNEVKHEYDANGLLAKDFSNPSGAVNTSTSLYVGYTYDAAKSGDLFTKRLRPTSLRYPSATMINYTYGTSGSVDDLLNRFKTVQNGSTSIVDYTDMGLATPAIVKYPVPNLALDYTATGALDRFGRITDHAWKNASGTALVQIKHGYDRVGNRLYREDIAAAGASKSFDELYAYDGMNQLVDMQRGKLNVNKNGIASGKNYQDNFAFDATGNWTTYKQDTTGAGFSLTQARTHNKANEVLTIAGAATHVSHDLNGNMKKFVKPSSWSSAFDLVYDAWNRLIQVKDGATVVATYSYNGLNHRVRKVVGSETRLFYFNQGWQCVEEHVGSTCDARYVWGLRYIDDLVTYRKGSTDYYSLADANWNVVALTSAAGAVQERYTYSAFGKVNIFDAAFATRATSACSVTRTFTGQVLDNETGLMLYRNRVYHPTLGRFVQRDPIGYNAGDVNLMRYVGNRSVNRVDPLGLQSGMPPQVDCPPSNLRDILCDLGAILPEQIEYCNDELRRIAEERKKTLEDMVKRAQEQFDQLLRKPPSNPDLYKRQPRKPKILQIAEDISDFYEKIRRPLPGVKVTPIPKWPGEIEIEIERGNKQILPWLQ
ncbi:MAG: RHS repeat-associated core domain-containing protein, partial [Planctomycetaceae bacterium]|nr:RHS repeat-associated core domain-containing protein [Planctomycetaceae bacterium]